MKNGLFGRALAAAAIVAVPALTAGCAAGEAAPVTPTDATVLRLGYLANVTSALPLIGEQSGILAHALGTTTLKTSVFNAGPAAVEALFAGAIDAAYLGPSPAINAYLRSRGNAIRIISGAASGGAELVVQPGITSVSQLRGKRIATPQLGGTQDVALRYWLKSQGLTAPVTGSGDVSVVPEDNSQTVLAFAAGDIAGAWVPEPWASRLVLQHGGKVLVDERSLWPAGQFVTTNLVVSTAFLQAHPATVTKLLQGELATLERIQADPSWARTTVGDALKKVTGRALPAKVLTRAWAELTITLDPLAATLKQDAEHGVAVGVTQTSDISGIYDLRLLNALLRANGLSPYSVAGLGRQ